MLNFHYSLVITSPKMQAIHSLHIEEIINFAHKYIVNSKAMDEAHIIFTMREQGRYNHETQIIKYKGDSYKMFYMSLIVIEQRHDKYASMQLTAGHGVVC